jgi:hypothetical protein
MAEDLFFRLMRKGGFVPILKILADHPEGITTPNFNKALDDKHLYYNAYFRLRDILLKTGLIDFKMNADKDRVIYLPPKGIDFLAYIQKAQTLVKEGH